MRRQRPVEIVENSLVAASPLPLHSLCRAAVAGQHSLATARRQAPLPLKPGHPGTRTHDCKRNGTACLMVTLAAAAGKAASRIVEGYIEHHDANSARPFRWSKQTEDLVEAWKRGTRRCRNWHRDKESSHEPLDSSCQQAFRLSAVRGPAFKDHANPDSVCRCRRSLWGAYFSAMAMKLASLHAAAIWLPSGSMASGLAGITAGWCVALSSQQTILLRLGRRTWW